MVVAPPQRPGDRTVEVGEEGGAIFPSPAPPRAHVPRRLDASRALDSPFRVEGRRGVAGPTERGAERARQSLRVVRAKVSADGRGRARPHGRAPGCRGTPRVRLGAVPPATDRRAAILRRRASAVRLGRGQIERDCSARPRDRSTATAESTAKSCSVPPSEDDSPSTHRCCSACALHSGLSRRSKRPGSRTDRRDQLAGWKPIPVSASPPRVARRPRRSVRPIPSRSTSRPYLEDARRSSGASGPRCTPATARRRRSPGTGKGRAGRESRRGGGGRSTCVQ